MPRSDARRSRSRRGRSRVATLLAVLLTGVLVTALLSVGYVGWQAGLLDRWLPREAPDPAVEPELVAPPPGLELPTPEPPRPVATPLRPATGGQVLPGAVRRALAPVLRDRDLGRHVRVAVEDLDGGPGYATGTGAVVPASLTKVLTGVSVLAALGPEHTFDTRVLAGRGNRVVLVGGGDPLLASRPPAAAATYPLPADVTTLARRVARSLQAADRRRVRVGYDATLFAGPADNPAWEPDYVPSGEVTPTSALWVDEGRDPDGFGRVEDPAGEAARVFAAALADRGIRVAGAPRAAVAPEGAEELGAVRSAPLAQLVEHVVSVSDNEGAEVLLRHVGLATSGVGSSVAGVAGSARLLDRLGVDVDRARWFDGSGLSRRNRLPVPTLVGTLRAAADPARPDLRAVVTGLPVAGFSGSLTFRFTEESAAGLGRVRAKTGTLTGVHGLGGLVTDRAGGVLVFVAVADRVRLMDNLDARLAVDRAAAALAGCRCSR